MKLSKFFSLEEFTRSDTARKLGIDNTPTPEHIQNLSDMCVNLLDPLREAWGRPLIVTSGYRGYKLNTADDSEGCILVGQNLNVGQVLNSQKVFKPLWQQLHARRAEGITITIC